MSNNIDQNIIDRFTGKLKAILELELNAGNKIAETYESKDSAFPMPDALMIFLQKPFMTPIQNNIEGIEFNEVNDPHYWKAEYFDKESKQFLCSKFD